MAIQREEKNDPPVNANSYAFVVNSTGQNVTLPADTAALLLNDTANRLTKGRIHRREIRSNMV